VIAAVVSAFVAAGAAVATTQAFTLGTTNRVNAPSNVTNVQGNGTTVNPVDAPLLTLENKSTTANATPLSLLAAPNHPALKVNTQTKVPNLNADALDGRDSGYFLPKTGKAADADKLDGIDSSGFLRNQSDGGWHYIGDPGEPVFQAGWVNYDPATTHTNAFFQHAAYYRDRLGIVHLGGLIKDGGLGSTVFALPGMGLCPYYARTWAQISAGGVARVTLTHLEPTGTCRLVVDSGSNVWVSLDGISYRAWDAGDSS
jgi:hypothetical protein